MQLKLGCEMHASCPIFEDNKKGIMTTLGPDFIEFIVPI